MNRIFWATCPKCGGNFVVAWELRHSKSRLVCPHCQWRFRVEEARALYERWLG